MANNQEKSNTLKQECESLNNKLKELSDEELKEVSSGENIWDIAVKLKDKFNISIDINAHGKTGKPTLPLFDEASAGLIIEEIGGAEKQELGGKNR